MLENEFAELESGLKEIAARMLSDEGVKEYLIQIICLDEGEIAELNQRFRGTMGPTDVLTFTIEEAPLEGEIYVCPEQARKAAEADGTAFSEEIYKLLIHGILHLIGYHHSRPEDRAENSALTKKYLNLVGIPGI